MTMRPAAYAVIGALAFATSSCNIADALKPEATLTSARQLEGTWVTTAPVKFYYQTDFCAAGKQTIATATWNVTWVISAVTGYSEAREVLRQLEDLSRHRYVSPYHLAYVYTGLGEQDKAIALLEQAIEERAGGVYGIKGSFLFTTLRSHPRFTDLLKRMNLI